MPVKSDGRPGPVGPHKAIEEWAVRNPGFGGICLSGFDWMVELRVGQFNDRNVMP